MSSVDDESTAEKAAPTRSRGLRGRLRAFRDDAIVRKLVARAGPNTIASLASAVLGMVRSAVLMRALGVVDFGQLAVIVSAGSIVRQLFSVRTWEWTTVELAAAYVRKDPTRLRAVLRTGTALGLGTTVLSVITIAATASLFARTGREGIDLAPMIAVYGLVHLASAFDDVALATLRTAGWFAFLARYQIGAAILRFVLTLPLLVGDSGLWFAVIVMIASQFPSSLWLVVVAKRAFASILPASESTDPMPPLRSEWRKHAATLATMSATDTVRSFAQDADPVILGALSTPTEVGEFKATTTLMMGLHALTQPLYMAFYPELAKAVAANDVGLVRALKRRLTILGFGLGTLAMLGTVFVGPYLLEAIYGDAVASSGIDLRIMGISMLTMATHWANPLFASLGRTIRSTAMIAASLVAKAALLFALVPSLGSTGAAIAFSAYFLVSMAASWVLSRDYPALLAARASERRAETGE